MKKIICSLAVVLAVVFQANFLLAEDDDLRIVGPKVAKVGQVCHFMVLDSAGALMHIPRESLPKDLFYISGGDEDGSEFSQVLFQALGDNNALYLSVIFREAGEYEIVLKGFASHILGKGIEFQKAKILIKSW